jgi:hypothetical protein
MMHNFRGRVRAALALGAIASLGAATACSSDRLLSAENPDNIDPSAVNSPAGAEGLRIGSLAQFRTALLRDDTGGEGILLASGMLTDEWKNGNTFTQTQEIDLRNIRADNLSVEETYRRLNRARVSAIRAIKSLKTYSPTLTANIGQQYFVRGYTELLISESYCNGTSLGDASEATSPDAIAFTAPLSNAKVLEIAIASFDSALTTLGTATDANTVNIRNATLVAKARALVGQGQYDAAAALVAGVPTSYQYLLTFAPTSGYNGVWSLNSSQRRYTVGDSVSTAPVATTEKNSIPFASLNDPRVPVTRTGSSFSTDVPFVRQEIWRGRDSSFALIKGVDARLIEAEAQLKAGSYATYFTTMNAIRAGNVNPQTGAAAPLAPLVDPVTDAGRVSQFFREKALWQFARGYRLGDLRRLVRQYGRTQDQVFPSGAYFRGSDYGSDVNFPIPQAEQNNPNSKGCTDRSA